MNEAQMRRVGGAPGVVGGHRRGAVRRGPYALLGCCGKVCRSVDRSGESSPRQAVDSKRHGASSQTPMVPLWLGVLAARARAWIQSRGRTVLGTRTNEGRERSRESSGQIGRSLDRAISELISRIGNRLSIRRMQVPNNNYTRRPSSKRSICCPYSAHLLVLWNSRTGPHKIEAEHAECLPLACPYDSLTFFSQFWPTYYISNKQTDRAALDLYLCTHPKNPIHHHSISTAPFPPSKEHTHTIPHTHPCSTHHPTNHGPMLCPINAGLLRILVARSRPCCARRLAGWPWCESCGLGLDWGLGRLC